MGISPTAEGFRAAWRRPSLTVAEMAWRWSAGAAALSLFLFGFREYLSTLPVSSADLLFLRSGQPALVGQAIAHILRGSLQRAVMSSLVAALALSVLWIIAASLGRMATARAAIEYFRVKFSAGDETAIRGRLRGLLGLNFLRAAVGLATLVGALFGTSTIAARVSTPAAPRPEWAFLLFTTILVLALAAGWMLNWVLSLAGVFAVRDSASTLQALSAAVALCRDRTGAVLAVSVWFGLGHLAVFSVVWSVVAFPLQLAPIVPGRAVLAALALIALAYFAIVDWLYVARLAGYACIAEMPETTGAVAPLPLPQWVLPAARAVPADGIDRDEAILSDVFLQ